MISPVQIVDIVRYANPRRTIIIEGAPGIGKSYNVMYGAYLRAKDRGKIPVVYSFYNSNSQFGQPLTEELLQEIEKNPDKYFIIVDLRLSTKEPTDLEGLLEKCGNQSNYVRYLPPLWAKLLALCEGVLFLDEIADVQRPDVKAATYQLLLDKQAGNVKFRDDVLVIGACNSEEYSSLSTGFSLPQARRCRFFEVRVPTVEEWIEFMDRVYEPGNWDRSVAAYLSHYKDSLLKLPVESIEGEQPVYKSEVYEAYPSPDSWTHLALALVHEKELISMIGLTDFVSSFVGINEAYTFVQFYEEVVKINIDELLKNPEQIKGFDWNKKAAAITQIANRITDDYNNILKYKPLLDALVFDNSGAVKSDYLALLKTCLPDVEKDTKEIIGKLQALLDKIGSNGSSNSNRELTKLATELTTEIETLIDMIQNMKSVNEASIIMYILSVMDKNYDTVIEDIAKKITAFVKR